MKEDFSELVEYLDGKFNTIDTKFNGMAVDIAQIKSDKADKKDIDSIKEIFNELQTSVDKYAGKADKYFEEMVSWSAQVKRHEKWLQMIAEKVGIKLEY